MSYFAIVYFFILVLCFPKDRKMCTSIYFITRFYHIILCTQLRRAVYYGPYIELLDTLANLDHFKCIRDPKKFDSGEYELDPQEVPLSHTHSLRLSRAHLSSLVFLVYCFHPKTADSGEYELDTQEVSLSLACTRAHSPCISHSRRETDKIDSGEYELDPQEVPLTHSLTQTLSRAFFLPRISRIYFPKIRLFSYSFHKTSDLQFFFPQKSDSDFSLRTIRLGFFLACTSFSIHMCVLFMYVYFLVSCLEWEIHSLPSRMHLSLRHSRWETL